MFIASTLCLVSLVLTAQDSQADNSDPANAATMPDYSMYDTSSVFVRRELTNVDAVWARESLVHLFGSETIHATVVGDRALLLRLSPYWASEVEQAVNMLDQPAPSQTQREIVTYRVKHRSAQDMVRRLHELFGPGNGDPDARIAADDSRAMVLISASQRTREQVVQLLTVMDQPARSVNLEFSLLCAGPATTDRSDPDAILNYAVALPADLKPVGDQLASLGELRLLGRCTTTAGEERPFSVRGAIAGRYQVEVEGAIIQGRGAEGIQLQLSAELTGQGNPPMVFKVKTTADVRGGETLVLGAAPVGATPGESAVIVVRARDLVAAK